MKSTNNTFGLMLRKVNRYGTDYVIAELVRREDDHHAPRNASDMFNWERPKHLQGCQLENLVMEGFLTDPSQYGSRFIGYEPRYRNVYSADLVASERMAKTLRKIYNRARKDEAQTPEHWFMALCSTLRLSFVVECASEYPASSYDDNKWNWMSVNRGRNRYLQLIDEVTKAAAAA